MMKLLLCLFLFCCTVYANTFDYYWKDYDGVLPSDALPGGRDGNGKTVYIGQAYIHEYGIAVVLIYPGAKEVEVPMYGYKTTDKLIKVLCSNSHDRFGWLRTNVSNLHVDTITTFPVPGGYDHRMDFKGILNIGRIKYENQLKIGSVAAYSLGNSLLYFPHKNQERNINTYEVLVYFDVQTFPYRGNSSMNNKD